jgi:hypothetical protein
VAYQEQCRRYHGSRENRQYGQRWIIFKNAGLVSSSLEHDEQGLWQFKLPEKYNPIIKSFLASRHDDEVAKVDVTGKPAIKPLPNVRPTKLPAPTPMTPIVFRESGAVLPIVGDPTWDIAILFAHHDPTRAFKRPIMNALYTRKCTCGKCDALPL